jgi:hypothetical protein
MTDAELFAERIYFTPEERRAFLRGVEWACPKKTVEDNWALMLRRHTEHYKKNLLKTEIVQDKLSGIKFYLTRHKE